VQPPPKVYLIDTNVILRFLPADHPLIVHLASADEVDRWAATVPTSAQVLIDAAWPGPLTVILPRAVGVLDVVTGGLDTVGLRGRAIGSRPRRPETKCARFVAMTAACRACMTSA